MSEVPDPVDILDDSINRLERDIPLDDPTFPALVPFSHITNHQIRKRERESEREREFKRERVQERERGREREANRIAGR